MTRPQQHLLMAVAHTLPQVVDNQVKSGLRDYPHQLGKHLKGPLTISEYHLQTTHITG